MPKTVEEALALDKENGNNLWWKAIQKKMNAVEVAFKILEETTNWFPVYEMSHGVLNQDGGLLLKSMPSCSRRP